jgi:hypothetical protein
MNFAPKDEKPIHKEETRCPYCQRHFQTQDELTLHIVTRHTNTGITRGAAQAGSGGGADG